MVSEIFPAFLFHMPHFQLLHKLLLQQIIFLFFLFFFILINGSFSYPFSSSLTKHLDTNQEILPRDGVVIFGIGNGAKLFKLKQFVISDAS